MRTNRSATVIGVMLALVGVFAGGVQPAQAMLPSAGVTAEITVNTLADELNEDGDCALREAIQAANTDAPVDGCPAGSGEDMIALAAGVYQLALAGADENDNATGDLDIQADLVLRGARVDRTTLDAVHLDRVLHILPGTTVVVGDLTIANGQAPTPISGQPGEPGGGVLNEGALTLEQVNLRSNQAGHGADSAAGENNGGHGGGIFNSGALTLTLAEVSNNLAGAGGGNGGDGGDGGGIYNTGAMTLTQSIVISNTAGEGGVPATITFPQGGFGGNGGGIANTGLLRIDRTTIGDNGSGDSNNYIGGEGGGVYNTGSVVLALSTVQNNYTGVGSRSVFPPGISGGSGGDGAGLYNAGTLIAANCTISHNLAASGIPEFGGSHTVGGRGGDGGGVYNVHILRLDHCTIAFNGTGAGASGFANRGRDGNGGGILNADTVTATVDIKNTLLAGNVAVGEGSSCHGALLSHNHNFLADSSHCMLTGEVDLNIIGPDALLLPLENNGGPTATHALGFDSPAIDAGSCTDIQGNTVTTDQRGELRPQQETCDIGAYETYPPKAQIYLSIIRH